MQIESWQTQRVQIPTFALYICGQGPLVGYTVTKQVCPDLAFSRGIRRKVAGCHLKSCPDGVGGREGHSWKQNLFICALPLFGQLLVSLFDFLRICWSFDAQHLVEVIFGENGRKKCYCKQNATKFSHFHFTNSGFRMTSGCIAAGKKYFVNG